MHDQPCFSQVITFVLLVAVLSTEKLKGNSSHGEKQHLLSFFVGRLEDAVRK